MCDNKMTTRIQFKLSDDAKEPKKGSRGSAGWDLYSPTSGIIPSGTRKLIKTGVFVAMPSNLYGRVAPRSGLAYNHGIMTMAGVIDSDYRDEIGVILYNTDEKDFKYTTGDRIAQLIFEKHCDDVVLIKTDELDDTERGIGGFGSTGV